MPHTDSSLNARMLKTLNTNYIINAGYKNTATLHEALAASASDKV